MIHYIRRDRGVLAAGAALLSHIDWQAPMREVPRLWKIRGAEPEIVTYRMPRLRHKQRMASHAEYMRQRAREMAAYG